MSESAAARRAARHPAVAALSGLIERIGAGARAETVFGAPVTEGATTVVPVARVASLTLMGGGSGRLLVSDGDGAGGFGLLRARPAGFVVLDGSGARFQPIRQPVTTLVLPLAVIGAVVATRIVGVSLREARRRRGITAKAAIATGTVATAEETSEQETGARE
ncbi:GerW family sporulation protein [Nocardiopsis lambiniae]|uniref:Sporulation protein n=1 Tax=Nocardiopsis lambiniae TaxID=3075539 RepID=A0ABU2M5X4_9ACTN|nr:hypothetical protein [Nocardiopsis sp. DSM 44743]MDT0328051.1 hypothetical protein [Nocardiopsis sp. DSM 44743]